MKQNLLAKTCFIHFFLFCITLCWFSYLSPVSATEIAQRGLVRIKAKQQDNSIKEVELYRGSYALIIGVSNYTGGWPPLPGVLEDVQAVKAKLVENGFTVTTVMDPDAVQLKQSFENFISQYGNDANNRLLFYFSGHGHTLQPSYGGDSIGYIVPRDAPSPMQDPEGFKRMAMSMQRIEEFARTIDSKHAMFLFDSCFSGSLFALSRAIPEDISYKTAKPVRQFITSGGEDEQVPDKSVFRQQFISGLNGEADANKDGYVTGTELGSYLQSSVINYSKGYQHPQYGKIRHPNLDKGDFVFALAQTDQITTSDTGSTFSQPGQFRNNTAGPMTDVDELVEELADRYKRNEITSAVKEDSWSREKPISLVFLDVKGSSISEAERDFLLGRTSEDMRATGRYAIVEREILDKLIEELRLSNSDLADPTTALKLGKILSASLIATGSMTRNNDEWLVNLRFIDTETTNIQTSISSLIRENDTEKVAAQLSKLVTDKLNKHFPLQGIIADATEKSASINIGSAIGVKPDMAFSLLGGSETVLGQIHIQDVGTDKSTVLAGDSAGLLNNGMRVREVVNE